MGSRGASSTEANSDMESGSCNGLESPEDGGRWKGCAGVRSFLPLVALRCRIGRRRKRDWTHHHRQRPDFRPRARDNPMPIDSDVMPEPTAAGYSHAASVAAPDAEPP